MFETAFGDAGYVTVAAGAKAGIISKWKVTKVGLKPDGTPRLRAQIQFSYVQETLMSMKGMRKRVVLTMRTKYGVEDIDLLDWAEARFEGNMLTLEDVMYVQGVVQK